MRRTFRTGAFQPDPDKDYQEEMEFHLEMKAEELMEGEGLSRDEAVEEARRRFGDMDRIRTKSTREEARRQRGVAVSGRFDSLKQDLRYALRTFRRAPGMTFLTLLILAVGIGANTAIFSVLKAVFLQPLPFPEPQELTFIWSRDIRNGGRGPSSFPNFRDWEEQNASFEAMGAFRPTNLNLTDGDEPIRIPAAFVTSGIFDVLGVAPASGRTFLPEEDRSERRVVVLSHRIWAEHYEGRPDLVGETVQIDGGAYTVIGIMPEGFFHPTPWGLTNQYLAWIPVQNSPRTESRRSNNYQIIARLREDVPMKRAQAVRSSWSSWPPAQSSSSPVATSPVSSWPGARPDRLRWPFGLLWEPARDASYASSSPRAFFWPWAVEPPPSSWPPGAWED